jgi:hypothetical protein
MPVAFAMACGRATTTKEMHGDDAGAAPAASVSVRPPQQAPSAARVEDASSAATESAQDGDADYLQAAPLAARSIGHTSVVFKVSLGSGRHAAFKPSSRRGPLRYKGEIAARRLALALDLPNVPRAYFRTFVASTFYGLVEGGNDLVVKDGRLKGALIPWIDGLQFLALEKAPLAGQWKGWLKKGGVIPDDQRELARQISTLVAFDFMTGNWDRWSGGNVGLDKASGTLLYIDNDGAFFEVPPQDALAKNERLLRGIDKLSRSFVAKVRELDDDALARAIGVEAPGEPLLSGKALAGVAQRRKQLLAIVDAKLRDAGEDATLAFP